MKPLLNVKVPFGPTRLKRNKYFPKVAHRFSNVWGKDHVTPSRGRWRDACRAPLYCVGQVRRGVFLGGGGAEYWQDYPVRIAHTISWKGAKKKSLGLTNHPMTPNGLSWVSWASCTWSRDLLVCNFSHDERGIINLMVIYIYLGWENKRMMMNKNCELRLFFCLFFSTWHFFLEGRGLKCHKVKLNKRTCLYLFPLAILLP